MVKKNRALSIRYAFFDFVRLTAAPGLLLFRPKILYISEKAKANKKMKGGNLIISNHITMVDPMYLMLGLWRRRHHFVATKELFAGKFKHWLFTKGFKCICIDRENFSFASFKEITDNLKVGNIVSIFPEGSVSLTGEEVRVFKNGAVMMALRSGAPIIPVYIQKREHWYSRLIIAMGEPVDPKDFKTGSILTKTDLDNASAYLREQEQKLVELVKERTQKKVK